MLRKLLLLGLGLLIALPIIAGLAGTKLLQFKTMGDAMAAMTLPPEPVNAAEARLYERPDLMEAVGTIVAVQGTLIRAEMEGVVEQILFEPGTAVAAGVALVKLNTDLEQAQLREAEAAAELARISLNRAQELGKRSYIAQSEFDSIRSGLKQASAQVDYVRALIAKKTIRAPFAGTLGIRQISIGQFIDKGAQIVSLQSLDPVYVDFSLPQQRQSDLAVGLRVDVRVDAYPGQLFQGKITAINPDIDPVTRNIRVQATLPNPDSKLRPGMYVSLQVIKPEPRSAIMVPATAIQYGPKGNSVFIIEPQDSGSDARVLRQQPVTLGQRQGDYIEVSSGVNAGEQVVTSGVFKLRPQMTVVVDNSLAPVFEFEPTPGNS